VKQLEGAAAVECNSHGRSGTVHASVSPRPTSSRRLDSELQELSLAFAADRYVGQSSGVSFARLTQSVLRRLKPDHDAFIIESNRSEDVQPPTPGSSLLERTTPIAPVHERVDVAAVITQTRAEFLYQCYMEHSHTLYPFLRKIAFETKLTRMYAEPDDVQTASRSWLYTFWMVVAIGSTARACLLDEDKDETESATYFSLAMAHFDGALQSGAVEALEAIVLQISYSFFNKVGANTWYLVGIAMRIAIGAGLHTTPSEAAKQLPADVQEYRKRLFYCLYMVLAGQVQS
jgi:hypothetical protein